MMKLRLFAMTKALSVCAIMAMFALASSSYAAQDKAPQASKAEQEAGMKVQTAPDAATKLKAAGEFVKKYPQSTQRAMIVGYVVQEINNSPDAAQKILLLENALTVFKEQGDVDIITPILIDVYINANRLDDAFRTGAAAVAKNPNDVVTLTNMALVGIEQAKKQNPKYAEQSQQFALKAIELIEAGKKPEGMDDARWSDFQTRLLPELYQAAGIVAMMTGKKDEAKTRLEKAVSLKADNPFTYVLLGTIANNEYQEFAEKHKAQSAGPLKDELLKQAHAKMDVVIDLYARAVALSEGSVPYKQLHDQVFEDLKSYYSYRHAGSTKGLDELIAKYKKQ